jgi:hypothetical protein
MDEVHDHSQDSVKIKDSKSSQFQSQFQFLELKV